MTDPHLNAEQLFGFRRRRTFVCGVCEGWFLGERMAVVSGWLVPLENSLLLSFLPRAESSTDKSVGDCGRKALTQRNATRSDGGHPTVTQHIFQA